MSSLYLNYFGLTSPPFSITPDPSFFFEGKDCGVFINGLLHATLQGEGLVVVIGEVGSGKTLMSRLLLTRLPARVDTVYLPNPAFSRHEIIEVIARDLGINEIVPNQGVRLEVLQQELIRRHEQGRQVTVLIDEAHAMPPDSMDEVRRLSNLETDNRKLVQVVLFGQPELDTLLAAPHLRQVRDRVVYRFALRNLSNEDSRAYLEHRLRVAGWRGGTMFSWLAERLLLNDARGRARRLNILADKALLAAYADNKKQVGARHVRRAIRDAGADFAAARTGLRSRWGVAAAWLASIAATVIVSLWLASPPTPHQEEAKTPAAPAALAASPALLPKDEIKSADLTIHGPLQESIKQRVAQSHAYARQQSATGNHTIRLTTLSVLDKVPAFIAAAEKLLPPGQIHVRAAVDGQQTSYVLYFGSFPTQEAAKLALADLPEPLRKDNPTIRTWKEICDAPWSL